MLRNVDRWAVRRGFELDLTGVDQNPWSTRVAGEVAAPGRPLGMAVPAPRKPILPRRRQSPPSPPPALLWRERSRRRRPVSQQSWGSQTIEYGRIYFDDAELAAFIFSVASAAQALASVFERLV